VTSVRLDADADPADYSRAEIRQRLHDAFAAMEQRSIAREMSKVFNEGAERENLFAPAVPEGFN